ncbi:MAG TPA: preprotein translocase subunit SecG [Verrucomicrobiae bacterium]
MSFIIGILTFFIVINCLLLILLVLIQLPKKDAGAGLAFGGGAADALFGAGSGNALTKITKWATVIFFLLAIVLGHLQDKAQRGDTSAFMQKVEQQSQTPMAPMPSAPPTAAPKSSLLTLPLTTETNASAAPAPAK